MAFEALTLPEQTTKLVAVMFPIAHKVKIYAGTK